MMGLAPRDPFENPLSRQVWRSKYQYRPPNEAHADHSITDTWARVAAAIASVEPEQPSAWARVFLHALADFQFLPAGRILASAGTHHQSTLFNCFVMDFIEDSLEGIFENLKQSALTMQWGGGIGCDFSTLRPHGAQAQTRGTTASGPISFMRVWDAMCATLLSTGARRGAMMATLRCDHPDIQAFVNAKRQAGALVNFNLSVQITDEFMASVAADGDWTLCFPEEPGNGGDSKRIRWPGHAGEVPCKVWGRVPARQLWREMIDAAYNTAEPGVLFVDRINARNNLYYREHITSTNPCGEVPLPAHGACDLGSINLPTFVRQPFSRRAELDFEGIAQAARVATRFLDDVIDASKYPLAPQAREARSSRRIGLGVTGLGDALIMLGLDYDSDAARETAQRALRSIRDTAYLTSVEVAEEKGSFPYFEREAYLAGRYVSGLPADVRDAIFRSGIRNSHLIAIAPTGTISLLANDVSSGIEPVFSFEGRRRVLNPEGTFETHETVDHALALWRRTETGSLPTSFVTARELPPEAHLQMQAVLQPLVDNSISKTINVPVDMPLTTFESIYTRAYELGLKGCTVFRPNPVTGSILLDAEPAGSAHCCTLEREGD
jgi:ribonucleoside-diphosphate reductase alpha chain